MTLENKMLHSEHYSSLFSFLPLQKVFEYKNPFQTIFINESFRK